VAPIDDAAGTFVEILTAPGGKRAADNNALASAVAAAPGLRSEEWPELTLVEQPLRRIAPDPSQARARRRLIEASCPMRPGTYKGTLRTNRTVHER
jgi:hypothetical protein